MDISTSKLMQQHQVTLRSEISNTLQHQLLDMARARGQHMADMMESVPCAPETRPDQTLGTHIDTWG